MPPAPALPRSISAPAPLGVVLAHQSDANMCQWLPYATLLAAKGYRVVAFDFAGFGASSRPAQKTYLEDIRTVVSYLRDRGTPKVVVMGASMGADDGHRGERGHHAARSMG